MATLKALHCEHFPYAHPESLTLRKIPLMATLKATDLENFHRWPHWKPHTFRPSTYGLAGEVLPMETLEAHTWRTSTYGLPGSHLLWRTFTYGHPRRPPPPHLENFYLVPPWKPPTWKTMAPFEDPHLENFHF